MNKLRFALTTAVFFSCLSVLHAIDKVTTFSREHKEVTGKITSITRDKIVIKVSARETKSFLLSEFQSIQFSAQHSKLTAGQRKMKMRDFKGALEQLLEVPGSRRPYIQQEIDFNIAKCYMKLRRSEGRTKMYAFVTKHTNSYHYYEGYEMLAVLAVEMGAGRAPLAIDFYKKLLPASSKQIQLRGLLGIAYVKLELLKKPGEAMVAFDQVMNFPGGTPQFKLAGKLGKATCMIYLGKVDQAIQQIQEVINAADPQYERMHARAYNALGKSYLKSKQKASKKQALWAFLIVDIVYSAYPKEHSEALSNLAILWKEVNRADRANDARRRMQAYAP